jgi:membrane carboxypeptidase/penicillin-binding protein
MNVILVKIFATALAFSQVATRPDAVKTHFDPVTDRAEVSQLLSAGCAHMKKTFDIENINLDDLISTAMDDPKALAGDNKAFRGIDFNDLIVAYKQFCKNETVANSPVDLGEVIEFFNKAATDLPDHAKLKGLRMPGVSVVLDDKGGRFAEVFEADNRRIWVPLSDIPEFVQKAFVAAEDKRFFEHKGIDERGLIRAFIGNMGGKGRPQGGSTITQQVAKTLLVGDDVTYDRKIREMIIASRIERLLSKNEILELYLNSIYLGRGSWGVEMATRSWFGKSVKDLSLGEGAMLAGLPKGPSYYSPDSHPDRAQERLAYVLNRMREDGVITADAMKDAVGHLPTLAAYDRLRRDSGFHFVDQVGREAKTLAKVDGLTVGSYQVHSTILPNLQRATEAALQDGLARYELNSGRYRFEGPEANLTDAIKRIEALLKKPDPAKPDLIQSDPAKPAPAKTAVKPDPAKPASAAPVPANNPPWRQALEAARLPLYDVHWTRAIVLDLPGDKKAGTVRVGLADGRVVPLQTWNAKIRRALNVYDVVYVNVIEGKGKAGARAELRIRPNVQGAALVLENKTGRILAMSGGFSYPLSQLNRASQAQRQPGSAIKPLTYLAALTQRLQPNTLVRDQPITLPPIGGALNARPDDYWSPKNYDSSSSGLLTIRRALEQSKNLVTAHLLDGAIAATPEASLDRVCDLAKEARIYADCVRFYPFVLGAQPVRMIDLAAFYAAIANEGARPSPHAIESIEQNGRTIYRFDSNSVTWLGSADRVAFYQLKTMLQGVVQRGTAASIRQLAPYLAGKTGTSEDENDAWFVGFTNDVTVVVWVGYDNADGKRRTLGAGQTGAKVAIPIFQPIIQAVWADFAPKTALNGPSSDVRRQIVDLPINLNTGDRLPNGSPQAFIEHFRLDASGRFAETQYQLVPREEAYAAAQNNPGVDGDNLGRWGNDNNDDDQYAQPPQQPRTLNPNGQYGQNPYYGQGQNPNYGQNRGLFPLFRQNPTYGQAPSWNDDDRYPRQRRVDPDYFWGNRQAY